MGAVRVGALAVVAVFALAACGNDPAKPDTSPGGYFNVTTVNVNGRQIPCVTWKNGYAGGLSCDWSIR